jgi:hypothetical protein
MAPKGSKGSNGIVEKAVQSVVMCLRTLKSSLDERMKCRINVLHPISTWLCEYTTFMMNRMEVGSDGKTAYERVKGKRCEVAGLEFAERGLYKYHGGKRMEKVNPRWGYGLFLGVRVRCNELIIVDGESQVIKYVRTVRRVPVEQRWGMKHLDWVSAPWKKGQGRQGGQRGLAGIRCEEGAG